MNNILERGLVWHSISNRQESDQQRTQRKAQAAVFMAVCRRDVKMCRSFLTDIPLGVSGALNMYAMDDDVEDARFVLQDVGYNLRKYGIAWTDTEHRPLISWAISSTTSVEMVRLVAKHTSSTVLRGNSCMPDRYRIDGEQTNTTPFGLALSYGRVDIAIVLVTEFGVDPNKCADNEKHPFAFTFFCFQPMELALQTKFIDECNIDVARASCDFSPDVWGVIRTSAYANTLRLLVSRGMVRNKYEGEAPLNNTAIYNYRNTVQQGLDDSKQATSQVRGYFSEKGLDRIVMQYVQAESYEDWDAASQLLK